MENKNITKFQMCLDMGASMSKYVVQGAKGWSEHKTLSNSVCISATPNDAIKQGSNTDENRLNNFEFIATKIDEDGKEVVENASTPLAEVLGKYISFGNYAMRGNNTVLRPGVDNKKCTQPINYASILGAITIECLKDELYGKVKVMLAVPPIEIRQAQLGFSALVGKYSVKILGGGGLPEELVEFEIEEIVCTEESRLTAASYFFSKEGRKNSHLATRSLLIFDIGASTTDVGIFKDGSFQDNTQQTIRLGGNLIRDMVRDRVYEEYELTLSGNDLEKAIETGIVYIYNKEEDITHLIKEAQEYCAKEIRKNMDTYFKKVGVDVKTLAGVILSGGGSLSCSSENNSVGHYLSTILNLPAYYYGDGARFANVDGLKMRVMYSNN